MKSTIPKVLHTIGGRSLVGHALRAARGIRPSTSPSSCATSATRSPSTCSSTTPTCSSPTRTRSRAPVARSSARLEAAPGRLRGHRRRDLRRRAAAHIRDAARRSSPCTTRAATPSRSSPPRCPTRPATAGSLRDADGTVAAIVEQKDATDEQRAIARSTAGSMRSTRRCCARPWPRSAPTTPRARSTSPTSSASPAAGASACGPHLVEDLWQTEGVNDKVQLARLGAELNRRTVEAAMRDGAIVIDPATTWIDADVTIGPDTVVHPDTQILGATSIGRDCVIGPDTTLHDVEVDDGASVVRTQAELAEIGPGATVGPFSYLRPGTAPRRERQDRRLRRDEERRRSATAPRCRTSATAATRPSARGANIGAGTIFANYDGVTKRHTTVGRAQLRRLATRSSSRRVTHRRRRLRRQPAPPSSATSSRRSSPSPGPSSATSTAGSRADAGRHRDRRAGRAADSRAATAVTAARGRRPTATDQLSTEPKDANG